MEEIKNLIKKINTMGFNYIFLTGIINKVFIFFTNIVVVRLLTKEDYGIFSYAYNIISFVAIFSGFGMNESAMQYGAETTEKTERLQVYRFTMNMGMFFNLICAIGILLYAQISPLSVPEGRVALSLLSFLLIPQFLFGFLITYFRVELKNKLYGLTTNVNSIGYFIFACVGVWVLGIYGTIIGIYLGLVFACVLGISTMKEDFFDICKCHANQIINKVQIIKYGFTVVITNGISQILYTLDVFLVGLVVGTTVSIAEYTTATIIPTTLASIPLMICTFVYPYFARNRQNKNWVKKNYQQMQLALIVINFVISLVGIIFAPLIIRLAFGSNYEESVLPFRILMGSYFISGSFRIPSGNVLAMLHKVNVNLVLSIISCVFNIIFDVILIKQFGSQGAAWATFSVVLISSIMSNAYLYYHLSKQKE